MHPALSALLICLGAAALEGICAGSGVRARLRSLRQPTWAPPFPLWVAIGGLYYLACGIIAFRLLRLGLVHPGVGPALGLLALVLITNAVWNLAFFRRRNLRLGVQISVGYALLAVALGILLWYVDRVAGWAWVPYLAYLIYGTWWVVAVRRLNTDAVASRPLKPT